MDRSPSVPLRLAPTLRSTGLQTHRAREPSKGTTNMFFKEPEACVLGNHHRAAVAIVESLFPDPKAGGLGVDHAIRIQLVETALGTIDAPRTISQLRLVLERLTAGGSSDDLIDAMRDREKLQPNLMLSDLVGMAS